MSIRAVNDKTVRGRTLSGRISSNVRSNWQRFRATPARMLFLALIVLLSLLAFRQFGSSSSGARINVGPSAQSTTSSPADRQSLYFEPNVGQTDPAVRFMVHVGGGSLFFTPKEVVLVMASVNTPHETTPDVNVPRSDQDTRLSAARSTPPIRRNVVRMSFVDAGLISPVEVGKPLAGKVNYLIGNDPSQWHTNLPTYASIAYKDIYPGVMLNYSGYSTLPGMSDKPGTKAVLEGTYSVQPGADPSQIRWRYGYLGTEGEVRQAGEKVELSTDQAGNLEVRLAQRPDSTSLTNNATAATTGATGGAEAVVAVLTEQAPVAWQEINGQRVPVAVQYKLPPDADNADSRDRDRINSGDDIGGGIISFQVGDYNHAYPLIIDPSLYYSSYIGGSGVDSGYALGLDGSGYTYIGGETASTNFPFTGSAFQRTYGGGTEDAFVAKFNTLLSGSSSLIYATYLGGNGFDRANNMAVDSNGYAYITGYTNSTNFPGPLSGGVPGAPNGFQTTLAGGYDAFIAKLKPNGTDLTYSSYLGGSSNEWVPGEPNTTYNSGITVDGSGYAYISGMTTSTFAQGFPATVGAFQRDYQGGARDAWLAKVNTNSSGSNSLVYCTYLGSNGDEVGVGVAVDGQGQAYVSGAVYQNSSNFPTTANAFQQSSGYTIQNNDVFLTKFNASGSGLLYSTLYGSTGYEGGARIKLVGSVAYLAGNSNSSTLPTGPNAKSYRTSNSGDYDAILLAFNTSGSGTGSLLYTSFLGGSSFDSGRDLAVDGSGNAYIVGYTGSTSSGGFPTRNAIQTDNNGGLDAFVAELNTNVTGDSSLVFSTFFGGASDDLGFGIGLDSGGNAYIGGTTSSTPGGTHGFPILNGYQTTLNGTTDAFVAMIDSIAPTPTPTVTCASSSEWCTDLSPNVGTGSNELRGVVATNNNDVWAVGGSSITPQGGQPLIEHWTNGVWATVSPVPTIGVLNGVASLSGSDAWAVSDSGVIHWNGTSWSTSPAPNGAKAISAYSGGAPTAYDVWAVGTTNVEHYDGTSWSVSTPVPSGGALNGVVAINHSDVWTVGSVGTNPLAMHYTGNWATVSIPTPTSATAVTLYSVDAYSSKSVWIAGTYYADGYYQTLIDYWDGVVGNNWRIVPSPNYSRDENDLYRVYVTYPGDVWAVGAYDNSGLGPQSLSGFVYPGLRTLILHWNGQTWDRVDSPAPGVGSQLLAITGATSLSPSGQIISSNWAVGSYENSGISPSQTLIEHITPPTTPVRTRSYYELTTSTSIHKDQGCAAATSGPNNGPSGLVILDYGQPRDWSISLQHDWGSYLIPGGEPEASRHAHISGITAAVEAFIDGYESCVSSGLTQLHIAVSINNDVRSGGATLSADHARAWADMVKAIQAYAYGYPAIFVSAGIDGEPDFDPGCYQGGWCGDSQLSNTEKWIQAYSDKNVSPVFNFGSLDGYPCRPSGYGGFPPPRSCRADWNQDRNYSVAWGISQARPVPEIYNSGWARDWYIVKRWGLERYPSNPAMEFKGVMTECNGDLPNCQSNFPSGPGLDYRQAWPILWLEVNSDPVIGLFPYWPTYIQSGNY